MGTFCAKYGKNQTNFFFLQSFGAADGQNIENAKKHIIGIDYRGQRIVEQQNMKNRR